MHLLTCDPALIPITTTPATPQQRTVVEEFAVIARRVWARDSEGAVRR